MAHPMGLLIWSVWGMRLAAGAPHLHATLDSAGGALSCIDARRRKPGLLNPAPHSRLKNSGTVDFSSKFRA